MLQEPDNFHSTYFEHEHRLEVGIVYVDICGDDLIGIIGRQGINVPALLTRTVYAPQPFMDDHGETSDGTDIEYVLRIIFVYDKLVQLAQLLILTQTD